MAPSQLFPSPFGRRGGTPLLLLCAAPDEGSAPPMAVYAYFAQLTRLRTLTRPRRGTLARRERGCLSGTLRTIKFPTGQQVAHLRSFLRTSDGGAPPRNARGRAVLRRPAAASCRSMPWTRRRRRWP